MVHILLRGTKSECHFGNRVILGTLTVTGTTITDLAPLLIFDDENQIYVLNTSSYTPSVVADHYNTAHLITLILRKYYEKSDVVILTSEFYKCIKVEKAPLYGVIDKLWSDCDLPVSNQIKPLVDTIVTLFFQLKFKLNRRKIMFEPKVSDIIEINLSTQVKCRPIDEKIPEKDAEIDLGLYDLYQKEEVTDFAFEVANKVFNVHRLIFYLNGGEYFKKLFGGKFKFPESKLTLDFSDEVTISNYIDYVYLGSEELFDKDVDVISLFQLASFFGQSNLEIYCLNLISQTAEPENYDALIDLYKFHPHPRLKELIDKLKIYIHVKI